MAILTNPLVLFLISAVLAYLSTRWLVLFPKLLDSPNHRSSHINETPTGGGVSFVAITLVACTLAGLLGILSILTSLAVFLSLLIMAIIGWKDDHQGVNVKTRLMIQTLCVGIIAVLVVPGSLALQFFSTQITSIWLWVIVIPAVIWWINLFNFMDGIDGLASVQALSMLLPMGLYLSITQVSEWSLLMLILSGGVLGFLFVNWPPAKIFMGDVGSTSLALLIGCFALVTWADRQIEIWSWMILAAVFVSDATVTLIQRWRQGLKLSEAHRSHAYQILARRWQSHRKVTLAALAINLCWLLPWAWCTQLYPELGFLLMVLAYAPLIMLVWNLGAGRSGFPPSRE